MLCKVRGVGKKCKAAGGEKVEFLDYIYNLWEKIGHNPSELIVEEMLVETNENMEVAACSNDKVDQFTGVSIRNFDKKSD